MVRQILVTLIVLSACSGNVENGCGTVDRYSLVEEVISIVRPSYEELYTRAENGFDFDRFLELRIISFQDCREITVVTFTPGNDEVGDPVIGPIETFTIDRKNRQILDVVST